MFLTRGELTGLTTTRDPRVDRFCDCREPEPVVKGQSDTTNPDRGPMLLISGEKDHTVPWTIVSASCQRQSRNPGITEVLRIPNRGHSLTIDSGWREVADAALAFVENHAPINVA